MLRGQAAPEWHAVGGLGRDLFAGRRSLLARTRPRQRFSERALLSGASEKDVRRRLPAHMAYHMLFGFKGESGDGVVPIASHLRGEAQEEARSIRGFDEDHTASCAARRPRRT